MKDINFTYLIGHLRDVLIPLAHLLFPDFLWQRIAVAALRRYIEAVGTALTGSTQVVLDGERKVLDGLSESLGVLAGQLLQILAAA